MGNEANGNCVGKREKKVCRQKIICKLMSLYLVPKYICY